jgi:large subunit ribosomal protein L25
MQLKVFKRAVSSTKGGINRIRREGSLPAVIYVKGQETESIAVSGAEFDSLMRSLLPGRLSTTVFTLVDEHGKQRKTILKEIQYEPTTYHVRHLDFEELFDHLKVDLKVPIEMEGVVDCIGVKLGGVLRQVIRYLRVRCLPKDIPSVLKIDVRNLGQNESKRLGDLEIPETVRPLADLKEVAVLVAKR